METSISTAKRPQVRRLVRQPRGFAQGHATGAAGQRDATGRRDLGLGDTTKKIQNGVALQNGATNGKIIGK